MVTQVTSEITESIDWYLGGLARVWHEAVGTVRVWDEVSWIEQAEVGAEWPLAVDYLYRLLQYRQQGMFSPEQESWFQDFQCFMREHEAELETVLGSGSVHLNPSLD
jgi:hypothetical protein